MLHALLPVIAILSIGAAATLAALSLRLFAKTRPFAAGLAFLAMAATVIALAVSAGFDDPPRWWRSVSMIGLMFPAIFLAVLNLQKAWRGGKSSGDRWRASATSHR